MNKTPKLRFKEFSGDWESKKLGDIIEYKKGYAFKSNNYKTEGVRIIKISDTTATSIKDTDITCISEDEAHIYKDWELKKNDIIVSTVGSRPPLYSSMVGKIISIPKHCENTLLNQNLVRLRTNELSTQGYLYTYLDSKRYLNYIEGICRGNANQVSITLEDLFEYKVRLPKTKEQEKIASFFSLIDDKIFLQGEKVEALKDYKKGMMQKVFSRELRFKDEDGRDYPEWEETKLGDVSSVVTGNTPSTKDKDNYGNEYLWASPADLGSNKVIDNTISKLSAKGFDKVRKIPKGSILATCIGSTIGKIGMAYEEMSTNQQINTLICNDNINNEFIYYSLEYNFPRYLSYVTSQAVPIINKTQFQEFDIKVPVLEEQIKIGKILSKIEVKIEKEQEMLDCLNEYKKGLLQQMFV